MAAADVEVVRSLLDAVNRGEFERAGAMLAEDAALHQAPEQPDGDVFRGKREFERAVADWLSGFEPGFKYGIQEVVDAGERVLARVTLRGRGRASGVDVELEVFHVYELRDGKIRVCRVFFGEAEAERAAGLQA